MTAPEATPIPAQSLVEAVPGSALRPLSRLADVTLRQLPAEVAVPSYDRSGVTAGIVHIGVGNFHRAHQALYVDRCLHLPDHEHWGIVGVGLGDGADKIEKARAIKSQDMLYTLTEYASDSQAEVRVIGAIVGYLHAPSDLGAVLNRLAQPQTRIVSLTITEGGYNIDKATGGFDLANINVRRDLATPTRPRTAFGVIVEGLARRRAAGLGGFTILSCDNLRGNGTVCRTAILGFAQARDAALAAWIETSVSFPNSMVDRIAPTVGPEERRRANALAGIDDATPVIGESFIQWVIEDKFIAGRPAFDKVGVQLRDDVERFEAIKGRMLNASHMMLSYPALMCGYRLVDEAVRQPVVSRYLEAFLDKDVIPLVEGPVGVSLHDYRSMVLERFANPAIGDQLLRIAQNGVAKLPIFLSKTLTQLLAQEGSFERTAHCLASFAIYIGGRDLNGGSLAVDEPLLTDHDRAMLVSGDPLAVLRLSPFETLGLATHEGFRTTFLEASRRLAEDGPLAALAFAAAA